MPSGRHNRDVYTAELVLRTETKRFSTHFVQTPDAIFHGTVADMGYAEQSIPVPAGIPRIGDCRIVLDDSEQEWRTLLGTVVVNRCLLRIHRRKEGTSTADLVGIYEISDDWQFTQDQCIVQGRNIIAAWWEAPLLANLINRTNFPDLAEIDEAFPNIIMGRHWSAPENPQGRVRFAPMPETDHGSPETITRTRWCVAAHPVFEVVAVYRREPGDGTFTLVSASEYTITEEPFTFDDVQYTFTFLDFNSGQVAGTEIQGDVDGYDFRGDFGSIPQYTSVDGPIRNAVDHLITIFYLRLVTELHAPAFDIESFEDVMAKLDGTYTSPPDFEYLCDILFDQQISTGAAVAQILESQEIYLTQNRQGEIALRIILAGDPDRPVFNDNLHHLKLSVHPALAKPVYNRWRFFYDGNKTTNQWQSDVINDEVAQNAMAVSDGQSPETVTPKIQETVIYLAAVNDLDTAIAVINRRRQFESLGSHRVTLRVPTPENYTHLECAKLIGITSKFGIGQGGWNNAEFIVTDVVDNFAGFYSTVKGILREPVQYGNYGWSGEIPILMTHAQLFNDSIETTYLTTGRPIDPAEYPGCTGFYFEVVAENESTSLTQTIELVDESETVLASIEFEPRGAGTVPERLRSDLIDFPTEAFTPMLRFPLSADAVSMNTRNAYLLLQMENSTAVRVRFPLAGGDDSTGGGLGDEEDNNFFSYAGSSDQSAYAAADTTGGGTPFDSWFRKFLKEEGAWDGTRTWRLEVMGASSATATGFMALFNVTTNQMIAGTEMTFNGLTPTRQSVEIADDAEHFTDGDEFELRMYRTGTGRVYRYYADLSVLCTGLDSSSRIQRHRRVGSTIGSGTGLFSEVDPFVRFLYEEDDYAEGTTLALECTGNQTGGDARVRLLDVEETDFGTPSARHNATAHTTISGSWNDADNILGFNNDYGWVELSASGSTAILELSDFGFDAVIPVGATIADLYVNAARAVLGQNATQCARGRTGGVDENQHCVLETEATIVSGTTPPTVIVLTTDRIYSLFQDRTWIRDELLDAAFKVRIQATHPVGNTITTYFIWYNVDVLVTWGTPVADSGLELPVGTAHTRIRSDALTLTDGRRYLCSFLTDFSTYFVNEHSETYLIIDDPVS